MFLFIFHLISGKRALLATKKMQLKRQKSLLPPWESINIILTRLKKKNCVHTNHKVK